jgi:hypothetical protein
MTLRSAAILLFSVLIAACEGDHGAMLVGDNRSGQDLLARAVGTYDDSEGGIGPAEIVVILPAKKRLVIAELPFAGGFKVQRVNVLATDCTPLGALAVHGDQGTLIEIAEDLTVRLRDEYPQSGERAEITDRCRATPSESPSIPVSSSLKPTPSN